MTIVNKVKWSLFYIKLHEYLGILSPILTSHSIINNCTKNHYDVETYSVL